MQSKGNALVWLALIIGILALILAWSAFNRSGEDLEDEVMEEVEEAMMDDQGAAAADAMSEEDTSEDTSSEAEASVDVSVQ